MKKNLLFIFILGFLNGFSQNTTLISNGSNWKYLDNGSNQGTAWYGTSFVDASWASGNAELGYGDADEATVVSYGPNPSNKYITTYFRKVINIPNNAGFLYYTINFRRDDGSVIYINGSEVNRNNMPLGNISFNTFASTNCSDDGSTIQTFTLAAGTFTNGNNTVAVEIHQCNLSSSDLSLEFQLLGVTSIPSATIIKGPYLQIGTQNSMIVRWETDFATNTKLAYGTSSTALTSTIGNANSLITHSIQVSGLSPLTKYYYSIGTLTTVIQSGADNYFVTSPVPGTAGNYRFWVTGDCGNGSTNQTNCKNQYLAYTGTTTTDGWLLLGDNAYNSGLNSEYNSKFFAPYQNDIMKKTVLWPAPGNHDYYATSSSNLSAPYYSIFSTPDSAQAGGIVSGTPAYYSYDYGNIHFISLDSYGNQDGNKMYDTLGAQAVWLKADLAANNKKWTIAYWHHPPYTMGSHNSDSESDLVAVRTRFIRILERNKVDMIMCGHSHDYERSKLMKGHYGNEASFNSGTHNLSNQSGLYDGSANSCPYLKDSINVKNGTVYVLSGSAGQLGGTQGSFPHNAMHYSNATNGGSLILDIQNNRLDAKWLCADGVIRDKFTIYKDVNTVKIYTVTPTSTTNISASWPGTYVWSNSVTTNSISVTTSVNATFWVKDPNSCVADTFKFVLSGGAAPNADFGYSTAPYCAGVAVNFNDISTYSPTSWSWSVSPSAGVTITSPTSQNPLFAFNNAGTYSVTLVTSNAFGYSPSTKTIVINPNPIITVNSGAICAGQNFTINPNGANTYTIQGGNAVVSPGANTSYTVSGTSSSGCVSQAVATSSLIVNPNPTITVNNGTICAGQNFTINPNGANTYTIQGGNAVVSPPSNTSFTVIGTNSVTGCRSQAFATSSLIVNVNPIITVNNGTICAGQNFTINPNGANTYTIEGGVAVVSPYINKTYTVAGTNSVTGCVSQAFATSSLIVIQSPTITVNNGAICAGQNFTINPSGANTYTIQGANAVVSPSINTTYSVIGTNTITGCISQAFATSSLIVNANPIITVNSGAICAGQNFTINPNGANTYTIQGGNAVVSPAGNTSYTVAGTSTAGCVSQAFATSNLTVNLNPIITVNNGAICLGQNFTINPNGANTYSIQGGSAVVSPTSNASFTVSGTSVAGCLSQAFATSNLTVNPNPTITVNNGTICVGQNFTINPNGANTCTIQGGNAVVSPPSNTSFTVIGTNSVTGCRSQAFATSSLVVNQNPIITVNSGAICAGQNFTINPNGANTYTIQGGNAVVSPPSNAIFTVAGTSTAGCVSQAVATSSLIVNQNPTITVNNGAICVGQNFTINPNGANTYTIQGGNAVVSPSINTNYTVAGTSSPGCLSQAFATSNITVNPLPILSISSTATAICLGEGVTLTANGANTYTWSGGINTNSISVSPSVSTTYSASGTSTDGCVGSNTLQLNVTECTNIQTIASKPNIKVYPNPNNGEFTVELTNTNNTYITITNVLGQMIKTQKAKLMNQIDLNLFDKGIYFINVMENNQSFYRGSIIKE